MSVFIVSAFADEYSDDFRSQMQVLTQQGISHLEIRHADGVNVSQMTLPQVAEYKRQLDGAGLGVSSIGSPLGKIHLDDDFSAHLETARKLFEFANVLGTNYCRVFSFYAPKGQNIANCQSQVVDYLGQMIDIADKFGVTLCHENEALIFGENPANCLKLLQNFGGKLKAVFDMGNFVLDGCEPVNAYNMLKDYVAYFHIKDALFAGAIVPSGKGEAQIGNILSAYASDNRPDTFVTVEPHLQTFDGLNALVGKSFENPYKYANQRDAFCDGVIKFKEVLNNEKLQSR